MNPHTHDWLFLHQYWVMANYFPRWRGHVDVVNFGRTNSASELAKMNTNADYVITAENYKAKYPPNNIVAPDANRILENVYGMVYMPLSFDIPEGVKIRILKNQNSFVKTEVGGD